MNSIELVEKEIMQAQKDINFEVGDTINVHYKIIEGERERIQKYEGIVIAIDNKGIRKTFTVRRISYDIGIERIFPLYSPRVEKIEVIKKGRVRRAKLYYLRERKGKSAKLKERRIKNASKKKPSIEETPLAEDESNIENSNE